MCGLTADGRVWHSVRAAATGTWTAFADVKAEAGDPGAFTAVAVAAGDAGWQLCGLTADGRLWHSLRAPGRPWTTFGDVASQAGNRGELRFAVCAAGTADLHVCAVGADGRLWHTVRAGNGSWTIFDERAQHPRDRSWRYLEFRGLDVPKLRQILTDPAAIEAYREDPFNPYAIARVRVTAFQKTVVMRFVDTLLDEADALFAQFTSESVNEATMLYAVAANVLGDRPPEWAAARRGPTHSGRTPESHRCWTPGLSCCSSLRPGYSGRHLSATGGAAHALEGRFAVAPIALADVAGGGLGLGTADIGRDRNR